MFPYFFKAKNISLYTYAMFCLSIHLSEDIWLLLHLSYCDLCFYEHGYSFEHIPGSGIAGSYDNSVVNFLRKSLTVSQSSCTALHVYRGSSFSTSLLTSVIFFPPFLPVFLPPSFLPSFFSPSRKRRRRGGSLL